MSSASILIDIHDRIWTASRSFGSYISLDNGFAPAAGETVKNSPAFESETRGRRVLVVHDTNQSGSLQALSAFHHHLLS